MSNDRITIRTLQDLYEHESHLVDEINALPNGGAMFLAHPLRMLQDLGVDLTEEACAQIRALEPAVASGSDNAYEMLRESDGTPPVRIVLTKALFRRNQQ